MQLRAEARVTPIGGMVVLNERACLDRGGAFLSHTIRVRARAGSGPDGPLPPNRQGNTPWNDSGRLAASISYTLRQDGKGRWRAVIRPLGKLVDRDLAALKRKAKERTDRMRAAAALGSTIVSRSTAGTFTSQPRRPARVRAVRPVDSYAALAAVLSVRDARPGSSRAIYRVVLASEADHARVNALIQSMIQTELVGVTP